MWRTGTSIRGDASSSHAGAALDGRGPARHDAGLRTVGEGALGMAWGMASAVHALLLGLYVVPVALAMGWDAVAYRIPNWTVGVLVAGFPLAGLLLPEGLPWLEHLGAAALVFAVGIGLFAFRLAGGGDIKLLTAVGLWVGWQHLLDLMVLMGILGGIVVLLLLLARRFLPLALSMHPTAATLVLPRVFRDGEPVPYGLAIGLAALMLAPELAVLGG